MCSSRVVVFSQIHTKLPLPTVLIASLKTFSMEIFLLSKTWCKHTLSSHHFYSSPYNFGNCFLAFVHLYLTPFMETWLTGQCTEYICFLLNSQAWAVFGTKSVFTEFRTKGGHEESYRTHVLNCAYIGKHLQHVVLNWFSSLFLWDKGEIKTLCREWNASFTPCIHLENGGSQIYCWYLLLFPT